MKNIVPDYRLDMVGRSGQCDRLDDSGVLLG